MVSGKFISIEGTEGAGKSTAVNFIKDYFAQVKIDAVWTREPGGTTVAEEIRQILLSPKHEEVITSSAELLLMFAARAQHLKHCILPALHNGKWVVSDRFIDASYAYQGGGRGVPQEEIALLDKLVVGANYPDLTLLLDISPEQGFKRAEGRGMGKDRIEKEKIDFFHRVRDVYLERAEQDPKRIRIIDASLDIEAVKEQIRGILNDFIVRH